MTDISLDHLKSICHDFYDQGICFAAKIVRKAASCEDPPTLEQLADLLDSLPDTLPKPS